MIHDHARPGACYLCEDGDGTFPHADKDTGPLGLACPRCHQIVIWGGEDPAAIDTDRLVARLRTMAGNRQRADMRLSIRRRQAGCSW